MSNATLSTTWGTTTIQTPYPGSGGVGSWLGDHEDEVDQAGAPGQENSICTSWVTGDGPREICTPRNTDEEHSDFLNRHFGRVAAGMLDHPPVYP